MLAKTNFFLNEIIFSLVFGDFVSGISLSVHCDLIFKENFIPAKPICDLKKTIVFYPEAEICSWKLLPPIEIIIFSFSLISASRTNISHLWKHIFKILFLACHWKPFFCLMRTIFFQLLRLVERYLYENSLLLLMAPFFSLHHLLNVLPLSDISGCGPIFSIQCKRSV